MGLKATPYSYTLITLADGTTKGLTGTLLQIEAQYQKGKNVLLAVESGLVQASQQVYDGAGWTPVVVEALG
jgi:hypothetical protein